MKRMAKKFIDADVLFTSITDNHYFIVSKYNSVDYGMFTTGIKQAIDEMPAADVIEVVRCKDCKYLTADTLDQKAVYFCTQNAFAKRRVRLDDFCSYGERKDGDNNG